MSIITVCLLNINRNIIFDTRIKVNVEKVMTYSRFFLLEISGSTCR